jgi:uncharacterized protein
MNLEPDTSSSKYAVRGYDHAGVLINDRRFESSLILTPVLLKEHWPPQSIDELRLEHLKALIELSPEIVLLGTGAQLHFPDPEINGVFINAGIGFEVMNTAAACRSFMILASEARNVAAALII